MKTFIIGAGSDLGVHIDGAHLGPIQLMNDIKSFYQEETFLVVQNEAIIKSRNLSDRRKNEYEIEKVNTEVYEKLKEKINEGVFPITIGGDHSVTIPAALASAQNFGKENIGMICFSAHTDYETYETTVSGNIEGLSNAAINGYKNHELRYYHKGNVIQATKTVIVGARYIDESEKDNIKYSGLNVLTTEDIKEKGFDEVLKEAFAIASDKTKGIYISFDLDIIDPDISPGVSIPVFDGLTEEDAMKINEEIMKHMDQVIGYNLVNFNPLRDQNRKTEQIALNLLAQIIRSAQNKGKYDNRKY